MEKLIKSKVLTEMQKHTFVDFKSMFRLNN